MSKASIGKGSRIEITGGRRGVGVCGEVFWVGESRYSDGQRFGVRGDDGETYWVDESEVRPTNRAAPEPEPGETFDKGDRVRFKLRGREGTGTVFWTGKSRSGPGQRLGVRDDQPEDPENDAVWLDARQATLIEAGGGGAGRAQRGEDAFPSTPSLSKDELPPMAPVDDSLVDAWATEGDEQYGDEPGAW